MAYCTSVSTMVLNADRLQNFVDGGLGQLFNRGVHSYNMALNAFTACCKLLRQIPVDY